MASNGTPNRLRQVRESHRDAGTGLGDRETVARELGVSVRTLYRWEQGAGTIPVAALVRAAELFHTTVDWLLCR